MHGHHKYHDDAERRIWQEPEPILKKIGLRPGMTFVDVGCGSGFFALPAARMAGKGGLVYGIDVDAEAIEALRVNAEKEGLDNLRPAAGAAEEAVPCEGCADIVFFGICLHDFDDPAKVLLRARRMLKPGGRLVDLDWKKEPTPVGPPLEKRFDLEKAAGLIRAAGYVVESQADEGLYHYLILAR